FYNHFDSKEELFQAAVNEVLDAHGALLDAIAELSEDPAETFARSFRLTGRMFRRRPEESSIVLSHGLDLITSDRGLAPRSRRDIAAAAAAGRFDVEDPQLAMAVAAGALLGLGQLLCDQPERDAAQATDEVAENLLRLFGMPADEAHRLCLRPLPFLDDGADAVV
ncbi:TetR family transcriptional regulator, partial [Mycobacterium gastri 'Wayne']